MKHHGRLNSIERMIDEAGRADEASTLAEFIFEGKALDLSDMPKGLQLHIEKAVNFATYPKTAPIKRKGRTK